MTDTNRQTFEAGPPLKYAVKGVGDISSRKRRRLAHLTGPIKEKYGTDVSTETADVLHRLHSSIDGISLIKAIKQQGLDEVEDYEPYFEDFDLEEDEDVSLSSAMEYLDQKIVAALAPRDSPASNASQKSERDTVYIPDLINMSEGGDVYMAKTLTSTNKVRIAWDLNNENQVVVVDDYKWGSLLGWKKLKSLPHGKNKIREELGDQLSDSVLNAVAGNDTSSDTSSSSSGSSSTGRRSRTQPTDEVLNVATSNRHRDRQKIKAEDIKESFDDDGYIGSEYSPIQMLILFPTTTDKKMTDHWWVPGKRWPDGGKAAVANCNKGTFEYLNSCDEVWHIEDYLDQAGEYEFATNHGSVTTDTIDMSKLVLHVVPEQTCTRLLQGGVVDSMTEVLPQYAEENMYYTPEFPHHEDMVYAPITKEEAFWLRPALRDLSNDPESAIMLYGETGSPRDIPKTHSLSSDYKLYARARLPDWDFDSVEMETLSDASFSISLDEGGYELIETLGKIHDVGGHPFSETPEARWN